MLQVKVDKADANASDRPTAVLSSDEERPLLVEGDIAGSTATSQREDTKLAKSFNLIPDQDLPTQVILRRGTTIVVDNSYIIILQNTRSREGLGLNDQGFIVTMQSYNIT